MPDYRITLPVQTDAKRHFQLAYELYLHAAPYSIALSNFRYVGGYFTFTSDVTIPAVTRAHLSLEAAP